MTINAITASRTTRWSTCFFTEGGRLFHILTVKLWLKWMTEYNVTHQVQSLYLIILAFSVWTPTPTPKLLPQKLLIGFSGRSCVCVRALHSSVSRSHVHSHERRLFLMVQVHIEVADSRLFCWLFDVPRPLYSLAAVKTATGSCYSFWKVRDRCPPNS